MGESVIMDGRGEGVITVVIDRGNRCREYFVMLTGTDYEVCLTHFQLLQYFSFITHKYNKPLREKLYPYFVFYFSGKTRSLAT